MVRCFLAVSTVLCFGGAIFYPLPSVAQISFTKQVIDGGLAGAYWVDGADMDGDGDLDLVAAGQAAGIYWYANNGSGNFSSIYIGSYDGVWHVYPADIDRDGDMDVVAASSTLNEVAWFENTGGFVQHVVGPLDKAESVFAADFDNDGDMDIVAAGWGENTIAYWEKRGNSFQRRDLDNSVQGAHSVYGGDFDGDGHIDVVGSGAGSIAWYQNDGHGNFSGARGFGSEGALGVFVKDVDRNGTKDVLGTGRSSENVLFFSNSGGGGFGEQVVGGFGNSWSVYADDIDGDGDIDVVSGGINNHTVAVWLQNGGGFSQQIVDSNFRGTRAVFAGDLDGDGDADIAAVSREFGELAWWRVGGGGGPSAAALTVNSPNGGESWQAGSTHDITWTSTGSVGAVKIEFSSDQGASWNTIANSTSNSGTYSWQVPNISSNNCLVRISEANDADPSDASDNTFSITALASLTLLAPNGGEKISTGASYQIKWNSSGAIDQVKLEFSPDGGTSWETIASSTPNDGEEDWQVGNLVSNVCLIRIAEALDGNPFDQSDSLFQIIDFSVGVQAGNSNGAVREFMLANYPNPVRWSAANHEINIMYQLPQRSHVKLTLYDQLGRELIVLTNAEREAGVYHISWNGLDTRGELAPSGIYLYRLEAGALQRSNKILIVR
jgi:hypothetical protein